MPLANAEMSLAKTDSALMRRYRGERDDLTTAVLGEHSKPTDAVHRVTDQQRTRAGTQGGLR